MTRKITRGLNGETFSDSEVDVLGEALDEFQMAKRYAGGIANGSDRTEAFARARVADRLLERVTVEEKNRHVS